jgi:uncharacterized repeat protein (TIGR01451 family)
MRALLECIAARHAIIQRKIVLTLFPFVIQTERVSGAPTGSAHRVQNYGAPVSPDSSGIMWRIVIVALPLSAALIVMALLLTVPPSAMAAASAPAWRISDVPNPTAFSQSDIELGTAERTDKYEVLVTNIGGAAISEESVTVTDTLPAGVTTSRTAGNEEEYWQCTPSGAGQTVLTCTISAELVHLLKPGASEALSQLPGLNVYVEVEAGVSPNTTADNKVKVEGGGAAAAEATSATLLNPSTPLMFGLADFASILGEAAGMPDTQAASHPSSLTTSFDVTSAASLDREEPPSYPTEDVKDVVVDLPAGVVGDPQAVPQCPLHDLVATYESSACAADSQVGRVSFDGKGTFGEEYYKAGRQNIPVYNMVPERGFPAEFGFLFGGYPVTMDASVVGTGTDAHVRATVAGLPATGLLGFQGAEVTFFGDPAAEDGLSSVGAAPFLTIPSDCTGEPLVTSIHVDSYENPGARNSDGTPDLSDPAWKSDTAETPAVEGCEALHFNPTISLTPDLSQAGAPTGLGVNLVVPQTSDTRIPATPDLRQVVVKLPSGMTVSPSAANGLGACSPTQIALENNDTPSCPESSKIATVEVETPLLPPHTLTGSVYLAQQGNAGSAQGANPFNTLLAGYIVVEGAGVVLKIPGKIEANEQTGQLTATFAEAPQLPFSDFKLHFNGGPGAPLSNPQACGAYTPEATLSSWSGQSVQSNRPFAIIQGENGAPCPSGSAFSPSFTAGTSNNQAGAFSPLSVTFSRQDSEQALGGVSITMPPGLLGVIKGVAQCPEAQANAGACGPESLIGETTVAVGAGADPYWVKGGQVYLTGPYNGGPFGLSIVVPTTAGPFTLTGNAGFGKEVVRASIRINPVTAQITVASNPLPSILEGIPLQIRTVNVTINRAGFTFNPSDCAASSVTGTISSTAGAGANVSSPFQAANCAALAFKPSITISTQGKSSKADGASLLVKIAAKPGEANVAKTDLEIPLGLPARLSTLNKACLAATFEANPAACPEGSFIGTATVVTPVLSAPLIGPVIVVSHGGAAFPDVEIVLQGEGVEIVLDGHTTIRKGITYSNFEAVPDAPFSSFEANLNEGPHSIFTTENPGHTNLCAPTKTVTSTKKETKKVHGKSKRVTVKVKKTVSATLVVPTKLVGQNGAVVTQTMKVGVNGCAKAMASVKKKAKPKKKAHK